MSKTDKELAVDIVCAYISARFAGGKNVLSGLELQSLVKDAYAAVQSLPESAPGAGT